MEFASNGAAIANGVLVPKTEAIVLVALGKMDKPVAVLEIAAALDHKHTEASIYTLLARLLKRGGLVARQDVEVMVYGTKLKRVVWTSLIKPAVEPNTEAAAA